MTKKTKREARPRAKAKPETKPAKIEYAVSDQECAAVLAFFAKRNDRIPAPRMKVSATESGTSLDLDHPDPDTGQMLLMSALGTTDIDFYGGFISQIGESVARDQRALNFALAVVKGIEPGDQMEAMLAAQMAGVHAAMQTFTRRLADAQTLEQQDSAGQILARLARAYAAQMEALKRYRSSGQQRVIVEHRHVHIHETAPEVVPGIVKNRKGQPLETVTSNEHRKALPRHIEAHTQTVRRSGG